ncbi:hypothetical protein M3Y97_01100400 [Aphelenchoides bicaudatus]|nr:hypothetical protein M3Y97_01100400 [Aphelenchoides bicaudatus]
MDIVREVVKDPLYLVMCPIVLYSLQLQVFLLRYFIREHVNKKLSANFLINIGGWCVTLIVTSTYYGFNSFVGRNDSISFIGAYMVVILRASSLMLSVTVFFMMLDRVFLLTQPYFYKRYRRSFIWTTFISCFVAFLSVFVADSFDSITEINRECVTFVCRLKTNGGLHRNIVENCNWTFKHLCGVVLLLHVV